MVVNLKNTNTSFIERTSLVKQYFSEVNKFDILTTEQEQMLFNIAKNGATEAERTAAKQKIAECNQKFVISVAHHYAPSDKFLDCVSEGTIGLMTAIENFDPTNGVKFITFAVHYIRREITQYLRDRDPSIRKTNVSKTFHTAAQARNAFIQREEREPTNDELAEILNEEYGLDIKDTMDVADMRIISIDESVSDDDDDACVGDLEEFNNASACTNEYETISTEQHYKQTLVDLFSILTPREKKIISMSFGIGYDRDYDLKEIAEEVGLTSERVRQMKHNIIQRLQNEISEHGKECY